MPVRAKFMARAMLRGNLMTRQRPTQRRLSSEKALPGAEYKIQTNECVPGLLEVLGNAVLSRSNGDYAALKQISPPCFRNKG